MYTLQEINSYLKMKKECRDEFCRLPDLYQFNFIDTPRRYKSGDIGAKLPEQMCDVQLRLGVSDGDYTSGQPVCLCLGGAGHKEIFMSSQSTLYKLTIVNLSHVRLDQAFKKLLLSETDERASEEPERGRLKAWVYYLFLAAGHVSTLQPYPRFHDELRYACTWMAREHGVKPRTARQKAAVQQKKEDNAELSLMGQERSRSSAARQNYEGHEDMQRPASMPRTREQYTKAVEESKPSAVKRGIDYDESDSVPPRSLKRRTIGQNLTKLRQGFETFGDDLQALETEYADLKNDLGSMAELRNGNSQQAEKIAMLEQQLHIQGREVEKLKAASQELQERAQMSVQSAEKERAAREAENVLRKKAEDRLTEFLDAHKKMTAMFG